MALDLNGTTQYVSVPTAFVAFDTGTLSWWCAPDFASTSAGVESFFHDVQGTRYGIYKATTASKIFVYFDGREQAFDVAWTTGALTHFLFRYRKSDNTLDLWINGVQCVTGAGSGTWGSTALGTNARLGSDHAGARFFDGDVAEYATWNVLLDTAEIAALSKGFSPLLVRPTSLLGYLPLISDGRPTFGANAGTLTGSPAISTHPRTFRPNAPKLPKILQVITGTLSATLSPVTLASTGILAIAGSASPTVAAITLASIGTLSIDGTLSTGIGDIAASGAAGLSVSGALSANIGEISLASAGTIEIAGSLSSTLDAVTLSATGVLPITGSLALDVGNVLASGAAGLAVDGSLSAAIGDITLSASGTLALTGTLSAVLEAITPTSSGTLAITGTLGATLVPLTLDSSGSGAGGGLLGSQLGPITLSSSGALATAGVLSSSLGEITLVATGIGGGVVPPTPEPEPVGVQGGGVWVPGWPTYVSRGYLAALEAWRRIFPWERRKRRRMTVEQQRIRDSFLAEQGKPFWTPEQDDEEIMFVSAL